MRWWSGVALSVLAVACGEAQPVAVARDDVLVLELGGRHALLTESLREVRARLRAIADGDPGEVVMATSASEPPEDVQLVPMAVPRAAPTALPVAEPARPVAPEPAVRSRQVRLEPGQTLYRLAVVHLGDGSRWRELLPLNGWTEAELDRLPAGTPVRLP